MVHCVYEEINKQRSAEYKFQAMRSSFQLIKICQQSHSMEQRAEKQSNLKLLIH